MNIGGYEERTDWPKMGPLVIAPCLILAIRTAKWPAVWSAEQSSVDLDREIEYAAHLAGRVVSKLVGRHESIFPSRKGPWYQPNDEDMPK
jgi:hypothetical protein